MIEPYIKQFNESDKKPSTFHILVKDPTSGDVLADFESDIAIIGAKIKAPEKPQDRAGNIKEMVPLNIFYLGNGHELHKLFTYMADVIGQFVSKALSVDVKMLQEKQVQKAAGKKPN